MPGMLQSSRGGTRRFPGVGGLGGRTRRKNQIRSLTDRHELIFLKPIFKGGVAKKGKSGLIGPQDCAGREGPNSISRNGQAPC